MMGELSIVADTGSVSGPHRPWDKMQTRVEEPNIIYRVADAPLRLR